MDGSKIVAWATLASTFIAAGMLFRTRLRREVADPREQVVYDMSTAIALSSMLGSLPKLFQIESDVLQYAAGAVSIVTAIFAFVQLRRLIQLDEVAEQDR